MDALYTTSATSSNGRAGFSELGDGSFSTQLVVPRELGGSGDQKGLNPEQLFAMGYSACFGSALEFMAEKNGIDISNFNVTAEVTLGRTNEGKFEIAVILDVYIPGISSQTGEQLINEAHEMCPYSRAVEDNINVDLNLLVEE